MIIMRYMILCHRAMLTAMYDLFGTDITVSRADTLDVWHRAMENYLGYRGSPVGEMEQADDPSFVLGPVFCAAMKILSGVDPAGKSVSKNLEAMRKAAPSANAQEKQHVAAIEHMVLGEFSVAACQWDRILADTPGDILAHKCAHEAWFLIGDATSMRAGSTAAIERLDIDHPAFVVAAAQHGFALEETGDYAAAESWGRLAINMAPSDCWALHCLAHVYETQNRHHDAMALLESKQIFWAEQNLLNAHIWWHLALRHIETREYEKALAVFDSTLADVAASNRFRLTDGTSLLWRLELEGVNVGDRWTDMADKWAKNPTLHTNAFLDLHAAFAFSRCPDNPASSVFFDSLLTSFDADDSENAQTFQNVVKPLAKAFARFNADPLGASSAIEKILPDLHKVGGSIVQREIVERSFSSALLASGQAQKAAQWLEPKRAAHPNTSWLLRAAADASSDTAQATLLRRRADLMFAAF